MKVALVIEHFDRTRGAAEHLAVWLANELARRGHEVHVVCHDVSARINRYRQATLRASHDADVSHDAHPPAAADLPAEIGEAKARVRIHTLKGMNVNSGFGLRRFGRRARRWCAAHQLDVVHSLTVAFPGDIYHAASGVYAAMRSQAQDSEATERTTTWKRVMQRLSGKQRTLLVLERRALAAHDAAGREARRIVSLCPMMAEQFHRYYGVDGQRIVELATPRMDSRRDAPWTDAQAREERTWFRTHYQLAENDRVALFVGHHFRRKGLRYAIEAVARTRTRWKLLVVGLGKAREYVELAESLGIGDSAVTPAADKEEARPGARVLFVGPTRAMNRIYATADALVLPTFYDSYGLVVMEALSHGLPVVTTEFLGARELVRQQHAGTIVASPRSVDAIAAALDALPPSGTPEAAALAARARAAGAGADPEQYIDALLALYADVRKE